jgi:hypothetical protein
VTASPAPVPPLVVEATKKAGLIWVTASGQRPAPAWLHWRDTCAYVVTGPGEQPLPGLAEAAECDVTVRSGDTGGRIVTWRARVDRVQPGGEEWQQVVPAMVTARLNLRDAAEAEARWAATAAVLRLTPTGELVEAGGSLPTGSLAEPPPPSPARTPTRIPTTLHRRRRR